MPSISVHLSDASQYTSKSVFIGWNNNGSEKCEISLTTNKPIPILILVERNILKYK